MQNVHQFCIRFFPIRYNKYVCLLLKIPQFKIQSLSTLTNRLSQMNCESDQLQRSKRKAILFLEIEGNGNKNPNNLTFHLCGLFSSFGDDTMRFYDHNMWFECKPKDNIIFCWLLVHFVICDRSMESHLF